MQLTMISAGTMNIAHPVRNLSASINILGTHYMTSHSQINYALADDMRRSNIINILPFRGFDCNSDHYILSAILIKYTYIKHELLKIW